MEKAWLGAFDLVGKKQEEVGGGGWGLGVGEVRRVEG